LAAEVAAWQMRNFGGSGSTLGSAASARRRWQKRSVGAISVALVEAAAAAAAAAAGQQRRQSSDGAQRDGSGSLAVARRRRQLGGSSLAAAAWRWQLGGSAVAAAAQWWRQRSCGCLMAEPRRRQSCGGIGGSFAAAAWRWRSGSGSAVAVLSDTAVRQLGGSAAAVAASRRQLGGGAPPARCRHRRATAKLPQPDEIATLFPGCPRVYNNILNIACGLLNPINHKVTCNDSKY
jgi:hypothetical protein